MSPTGKSYSFRSCVRASEAACARETMLFPRLGRGSFNSPPAASSCRRVPFAVLCENHSLVLRRLVDRCKSLQIDVRQRRTALESV